MSRYRLKSISMCIPAAEVQDNHLVYRIEVRRLPCAPASCAEGELFICHKRMIEFREFHQAWSRLYPGLAQGFPLPKRVSFRTRCSDVIEKRRLQLQEYLIGLACISSMTGRVAEFLGIDATIFERELKEEYQKMTKIVTEQIVLDAKRAIKACPEKDSEAEVNFELQERGKIVSSLELSKETVCSITSSISTQKSTKGRKELPGIPTVSSHFRDRPLERTAPSSTISEASMITGTSKGTLHTHVSYDETDAEPEDYFLSFEAGNF